MNIAETHWLGSLHASTRSGEEHREPHLWQQYLPWTKCDMQRSFPRTLISNKSNSKSKAFPDLLQTHVSKWLCTAQDKNSYSPLLIFLAPLAICRSTWGGQDWLFSDTHDRSHWFRCWLSILFLGGRQALPPRSSYICLCREKARNTGPIHGQWNRRLIAGCQPLSGSEALFPPNEPFCVSILNARVGVVQFPLVQFNSHFVITILAANTY